MLFRSIFFMIVAFAAVTSSVSIMEAIVCLLYTSKKAIKELPSEHSLLVTMEENVQSGGFGEHVTEYVKTNGLALEAVSYTHLDVYKRKGYSPDRRGRAGYKECIIAQESICTGHTLSGTCAGRGCGLSLIHI